MFKLLVNGPSGLQEIIEISQTGSYFDSSRVLWDERVDGPLPEVTLGRMVRVEDQLVLEADYITSHQAAMLGLLKTERIEFFNSVYQAIVYSDIAAIGHTWLADKHSRELLSQVLSVGRVPPLMHWRDSQGVARIVTYADLNDIGYAILVRGAEADFTLSNKKYLVEQASTIEEVNSITWGA